MREPCETDRLETTVSYAKIIKTIRRVMQSGKNDLLEFTAQQVINAILQNIRWFSRLKSD